MIWLKQQARAFNKNEEALSLGLGMIFLFLVGIELFFRTQILTSGQLAWSEFVTDVILLNSLHIGLTIAFYFNCPEFKKVLAANKANRNLFFYGSATVLFFSSMLLVNVEKHRYLPDEVTKLEFIKYASLFMFTAFHAIWQTRGIALMYDQAAPAETRTYGLKFEKAMIWLLFLGYITGGVSTVLASHKEEFITHDTQQTVFWLAFAAQLFAVLSCLVIGYMRLKQKSYLRLIFTSRLLFWVLGPFSIMAVLAPPALHGIEYLAFYRTAKSHSRGPQRGGLDWPAILICCGVAAVALPHYFLPQASLYYKISWTVLWPLVLTHFFMDSQLFQMRKPYIRQFLAPLMQPKD